MSMAWLSSEVFSVCSARPAAVVSFGVFPSPVCLAYLGAAVSA